MQRGSKPSKYGWLELQLAKQLIRINNKQHRVAVNMQNWLSKVLSTEWTGYYLPEDKKDIETWCMEHKCKGTVAYDTEPKVCSLCKEPLPPKLMLAINMLLKKDLIRV